MESDAQNLVRAVNSKDFDLTPEGVIYRDIRAFVSLNFASVKFVFRSRHCNKVAHASATFGARSEDPSRLWLDTLPNYVMVLLASDIAAPPR